MPKPKLAASRPRAPSGETPIRAYTVKQLEALHPGVQGRLRMWIHRAGAGDADFAGLKPAILRIGRSVLIDETRFSAFLRQRGDLPPAPSRRAAPLARGVPREGGEA